MINKALSNKKSGDSKNEFSILSEHNFTSPIEIAFITLCSKTGNKRVELLNWDIDLIITWLRAFN